MEETAREASAMGIADSAYQEMAGEGQHKRRATTTKRKALSGASSSSSHSGSSKRLAKERNLQSFHAYPHSGPVTRARQSPSKLSAAVSPAHELIERSQLAGVADIADRLVGEDSELDAVCEPVADPNFDFIRTRESNVHVVPTHAGWFSWERIHHLEKQSMDSFFNGKSDKRTEDIYLKIRNSIMETYHKNPETDVDSKILSELDVGDASARQEVMEFLEHWGLINFHPFLSCTTNSPSLKKEASDKEESISEKIYRFEVSYVPRRLATKPLDDASGPQLPQRLFTEANMFENLVRPEGPSVEYHCNSCSADCSRKRYHCQKQADFDLCTECFNDGKFGSGMTSADFILMEPAEVPGTGGGSWTDQETLLLLEALELYGENWNEIAEHVATKTRTQCMLHFFQMPIEDSFLLDKADNEEKSLPESNEKGNSSITQSEDNKETENKQAEPILENIPPSTVISALTSALGATGSGIRDREPFSFAEAGNPVMALVAFFVSLADHDVAFTASRSSLKAMTEDSQGIQLAMRHCFALEDPPEQQKPENKCESQRAHIEVSEVSGGRPSVSSGECGPNQVMNKSMAEVTPVNDSDCTKDKSLMAAEGDREESKSKGTWSPKKSGPLICDEAVDAAEASDPSEGKQSSDSAKSQKTSTSENKEPLDGCNSDSALENKEKSGQDRMKSAAPKEATVSLPLDTEDEGNLAKLRRAAVSALAAAAVTSKVLVDQEEDCIRHLTSLVIEKQLRKLEIKLSLFGEIERAISGAREQLDRAKQRLLHERAQIISTRLGLFPSSSRSIPASLAVPKAAMAQSFPGPRPSISLASQTFTSK
ncbi:DNA-binding family protein [Wolffia australiana]